METIKRLRGEARVWRRGAECTAAENLDLRQQLAAEQRRSASLIEQLNAQHAACAREKQEAVEAAVRQCSGFTVNFFNWMEPRLATLIPGFSLDPMLRLLRRYQNEKHP